MGNEINAFLSDGEKRRKGIRGLKKMYRFSIKRDTLTWWRWTAKRKRDPYRTKEDKPFFLLCIVRAAIFRQYNFVRDIRSSRVVSSLDLGPSLPPGVPFSPARTRSERESDLVDVSLMHVGAIVSTENWAVQCEARLSLVETRRPPTPTFPGELAPLLPPYPRLPPFVFMYSQGIYSALPAAAAAAALLQRPPFSHSIPVASWLFNRANEATCI